MLYREEKPTKGTIIIGGVNVGKLRNRKVYKLRRKLGIVFQDFKLLPKLTVFENVAFALEMYGLPKDEIRAKTLKAMELVGLKEKVKNYAHELSGGEQQRVSIARAIAKNPKLLLCDEPTGALDSKTGVEVLKLLRKQCDGNEGANTVIIVTHNSLIAEIADTVVHVKNGKIESVTSNEHPKRIDEVIW
jgi:putative ABC transport system ATP-binding protein